MNSKTRKLKAGNESSVIIAILAILLILVAVIVGAVVLKDNKALVKFDGGKVTTKEYQVYYEMFSQYLQNYGYASSQIPDEILNKAISDKMILADAKKAGVKISKEDKEEVDKMFKDKEYIEFFKENYDFNIDTLRQIYYNDYIISAYIEKLATEAESSKVEEYIRAKYQEGQEVDMNEYDTSHILLSFTDANGNKLTDEQKAELKTKAEDILKRAKDGEDFAELAKANSADTATAQNGGQYLMYMDNYTVDEYEDAVKKMKVGEIYPELVETTYGYHIIKLNAKNENGRLKSETERQEYANSLFDNIIEEREYTCDKEKFKAFVLTLNPDAYKDDTNQNNQYSVGSGDNTITIGGEDTGAEQ